MTLWGTFRPRWKHTTSQHGWPPIPKRFDAALMIPTGNPAKALLREGATMSTPQPPAYDPATLDQIIASLPPQVKAGWKTTELWLTAAVNLVMLANSDGIVNLLPHQWGGAVAAVTTAAYAISRGLAKMNATGKS